LGAQSHWALPSSLLVRIPPSAVHWNFSVREMRIFAGFYV
jgi:hypothetical protein